MTELWLSQYNPASPVVLKIRRLIHERYEFAVRVGYADVHRLRDR